MKRLLFPALILLSLLGSVDGARAQEAHAAPPQLGIRPVGVDGSYFALTLEPGEREELTVELGNYGAVETIAHTYAADVGTRTNGGMEVRLEGESTSGPTTWLDYPTETLEIGAGKAVERTFTVEVPKDAEPGEHLTSLVIQTAEPVPVGGNGDLQVNQVVRQAIAVLIEIPGPRRPALQIGEARYVLAPASASVQVELRNTGNVRVKPTADLVVRTADGQEVSHAQVTLDSIYAGTETVLEVGLIQPLDPGDYRVNVSLEDAEHNIDVSAEGLPVTVAAPEAAEVRPGIAVESMSVAEVRDDQGTLLMVEAVVVVNNHGAPVTDGTLTMQVARDGAPVEEVVLGSSLSFPGGPAEFRQRYFPLEGWQAGAYTFAVTLTGRDPNTGDIIELARATSELTVTVT